MHRKIDGEAKTRLRRTKILRTTDAGRARRREGHHIGLAKIDHGPSYRRYNALQRQGSLKINFREIFGVIRFSTALVDSLKALDLKRPIREADMQTNGF
jgi:hypothetical protein